MKTAGLLAASAALVAAGGRPSSVSICDYYTKALLGADTAKNQETLLILVVNTAVIGNYTQPNVGISVPGILAPANYDGEAVNLLQYFNGALDSTNMGGKCGVSVNFLDGGGSTPLMHNKPANNPNSNQYTLLTHLYEYFGVLLGCSKFGSSYIPYAGDTSMYDVHKFMGLDKAEVQYFISQVGLAAASFGVSSSDVSAVGSALMSAFGYRCEPPASIPPTASPMLQSICIDCDCPVSPNADCGAYGPVVEPKPSGTPSKWCGSENWRHSQQYCGSHSHGHKW